MIGNNDPVRIERSSYLDYELGLRVVDAFRRWGIKYDYGSDAFTALHRSGSGRYVPVSLTSLMARLTLHLSSASQTQLQAVLTLWIEQEQETYLDEARADFLSRDVETGMLPGRRDAAWCELRKWIEAVCVDGHSLSMSVMAHWIWMIKRHLRGLPVTDAICPVLFGRTRGGKSTAALALLKPVKALMRPLTIPQISDERTWAIYRQTYVAYIDELAGADRACLETLKMLITAQTIGHKPLYTNRLETIPMHCAFLGTSNRSVISTIRDPTSGARYWELRCRNVLGWETINNIDYDLLWSCVAPGDTSPMAGKPRADIQELQHDKLRAKGTVEIWLDEAGIEQCEPSDPHAKPALLGDLHDRYKLWADTGRIRCADRIAFGHALKDLGYVKASRSTYGVRYFVRSAIVNRVDKATNNVDNATISGSETQSATTAPLSDEWLRSR